MERQGALQLIKNPPIVSTCNLTKRFGEVEALRDVSIEIPEGKIIGLLGPNGSGKTTFIKILAGLYTSYEGTVTIDGQRPGANSKAIVSYLPDKNSFPMDKTTLEIIQIYRDFFGDFSEEKCLSLLEKFQIDKDKKFKEMSKGMIDKVQVSLVMSRKARLYLLDEPLGGVDVGARDFVLDTILENFDSKGTILVATHLISQIERLFDSVVVLNGGAVVANTFCDAIREKYGMTLENSMKEIFSEASNEK
ncbi:MAG: ABC transporter ATP-binding protein [Anaerovoracaceae bacterium]